MMKHKENNKLMIKTRHSSLDLPDDQEPSPPSSAKKVDGMKTKNCGGDILWNKLTNLGDVLKSKNNNTNTTMTTEAAGKKSKTQTTLDYFLKPRPKSEVLRSDKRQTGTHAKVRENGRPSSLQKQMSVGSYPVLLNIPEEAAISRDRPATVCSDKPGVVEHKGAATLTLERPRKKLSFREPEITGYSRHAIASETLPRKNIKPFTTPQMARSSVYNGGGIQKWASYEDLDLEVYNTRNHSYICVR